jgi:hypothetical protein
MKLVKNCRVKVLFGNEWIEGRYLYREVGESEAMSFKDGRLVSQGVIKYDRRHVLLDNGIQYATSKKNIYPIK